MEYKILCCNEHLDTVYSNLWNSTQHDTSQVFQMSPLDIASTMGSRNLLFVFLLVN